MGHLIGYLKGKDTKGIIIRNPKVIRVVMFYDSNYATYKKTINSISGLVATLGGTLLTCLSKNQRTVTLISTEAEYVTLSARTQEADHLWYNQCGTQPRWDLTWKTRQGSWQYT